MDPASARRVANVIQQRRKEVGISAAELARRSGVDPATVTRLEKGMILTPRADNLRSIAHELGLRVSDVFVAADWVPRGELPSFTPYLRTKYRELPDEAMKELESSFSKIAKKYGYHAGGPAPGEDED